jgi:hypothetical protein
MFEAGIRVISKCVGDRWTPEFQGPLNNGFQTCNQNVITKTSGLEKFKL